MSLRVPGVRRLEGLKAGCLERRPRTIDEGRHRSFRTVRRNISPEDRPDTFRRDLHSRDRRLCSRRPGSGRFRLLSPERSLQPGAKLDLFWVMARPRMLRSRVIQMMLARFSTWVSWVH